MLNAKKLLAGSALRFLTLLIGVCISFFMMPFLIHKLGDHWYGLWILVASTLTFYGVLELGLTSAIQRYISYFLAKNDIQELNSFTTNALFIFSIVGLLTFITSVAVALCSPLFFDNPDDITSFQTIILLMGSALGFSFYMNTYDAVLTSYLRYDIQSYIHLVKSILRPLTVVAVFSISPSVENLAYITVATDLFGYLCIYRFARKQANWYAPAFHLINKKTMGKLLNFGVYTFYNFLAQQIRNRAPHFFVAGMLSISAVTIYQIATQLVSYFYQVQSSLLGIFLPTFTELHGKEDRKELVKQYLFTTKLGAITASLISGAIIMLGEDFIRLWLGEDYTSAYYMLLPLTVSGFFNLIHLTTYQLFLSIKKHNYYAHTTTVEAIIVCSLGPLLGHYYGIKGIALAVMISSILGKGILLTLFLEKAAGIKMLSFIKAIATPIIITLISHTLLYYTVLTLTITSILELITIGILVYPILLIFTLYISSTKEEKTLILDTYEELRRKQTR